MQESSSLLDVYMQHSSYSMQLLHPGKSIKQVSQPPCFLSIIDDREEITIFLVAGFYRCTNISYFHALFFFLLCPSLLSDCAHPVVNHPPYFHTWIISNGTLKYGFDKVSTFFKIL